MRQRIIAHMIRSSMSPRNKMLKCRGVFVSELVAAKETLVSVAINQAIYILL
jgi:hypothetical protein